MMSTEHTFGGTASCPICDTRGNHIVAFDASCEFLGVHYCYLRCGNCGLVFADPLLDESVLKEVYEHAYEYSYAVRFHRLKKVQAYHRAWRMRRILRRGASVLDHGCGHGYLVEALRYLGYNAYGFDAGYRPDTFAHSQFCYYGDDPQIVPVKTFDSVTCFHVLEHLRDPRSFLQNISERLAHRGLCVITVPNCDSLGQKFRGTNRVWLQLPYIHLMHFNSKNIRRVVDRFPGTIKAIWTADRWDASLYFAFVRPVINRILRWLHIGKDIDQFHIVDEWISVLGAAVSYAINPIHYLLKSGSELTMIVSKDDSRRKPVNDFHSS